jgi:HEAT repeat protein
MLMDLLKGDDAGLQAIAAGAVRTLEGDAVTAAVADALPTLDAHGQLVALYALRARGDRAALPAVTGAVNSDDPDVKIAALEALATVGGATSVELLTGLAVSEDPEVSRGAKASLASLRGLDVDGVVVSAMQTANGPSKLVLIDALAARGAESAVPELVKTAVDSDEAVRNASLEALGVLAGEPDLAQMLSLLVQMNGNPSQATAENSVVAVVQRMDTVGDGASAISRALAGLKGKPAVAASLVSVLGRIGDSGTLAQIRELAASTKASPVKDAAVRALADWPSADVIEDLLHVVSAPSSNDTHKALAFRGFLRLLRQDSGRPTEETLQYYEEAVQLASSADDKRLVLAGLAEIRDERALALVEPYLADEEVKAEAAQAAERIKSNLQQ